MTNANKLPERLVKKYPNRRLYDTHTSTYITLLDVRQLVRDEIAFSVQDAKTGEDLTRGILLQIVVEEETNGSPLFSGEALAQMIRYYGHAMQDALGVYLEKSVQAFADTRQPSTAASSEAGGDSPASHEMQALFQSVQEQVHAQSEKMFGGFSIEPAVDAPQLNQ